MATKTNLDGYDTDVLEQASSFCSSEKAQVRSSGNPVTSSLLPRMVGSDWKESESVFAKHARELDMLCKASSIETLWAKTATSPILSTTTTTAFTTTATTTIAPTTTATASTTTTTTAPTTTSTTANPTNITTIAPSTTTTTVTMLGTKPTTKHATNCKCSVAQKTKGEVSKTKTFTKRETRHSSRRQRTMMTRGELEAIYQELPLLKHHQSLAQSVFCFLQETKQMETSVEYAKLAKALHILNKHVDQNVTQTKKEVEEIVPPQSSSTSFCSTLWVCILLLCYLSINFFIIHMKNSN